MTGSITADAVILTRRQRHHLDRDHFGGIDALKVVLSEPIGPWDVFTPVPYVMQDLMDRLTRLEISTIVRGSLSADAYIWPLFILSNAVIRATMAWSITADAVVRLGGSITAAAWIQAAGSITADAVIV